MAWAGCDLSSEMRCRALIHRPLQVLDDRRWDRSIPYRVPCSQGKLERRAGQCGLGAIRREKSLELGPRSEPVAPAETRLRLPPSG